jgi:hypothetical protein
MDKQQFEMKKDEINRKYNRIDKWTIIPTIFLGLVTATTGGYGATIRKTISDNPYRNAQEVREYNLTAGELEKIRDSKIQLVLTSSPSLNLSYVPERLKPSIEDLSEKVRAVEWVKEYSIDEKRTKEKLKNLSGNEAVQKYHNWESGMDLFPWTFGSLLVFISLGTVNSVANRIQRRKISKLKEQVV